jgi:hypothetical protein
VGQFSSIIDTAVRVFPGSKTDCHSQNAIPSNFVEGVGNSLDLDLRAYGEMV